ncbi:M23 family metallopeptidase [Daejeonella lutea]|uniref:Murein DD-endopeptidase MepM and murein hydrolase activator NlpD, contain LysM domain n=1 Tax=Daejeonella lutea TaxID=572036 RepID=A0A1T5EDA2_9SPHI|nr:M23 family metallopeptidase [Daejeonella lutea]SKB81839.1 Murein DD-endopeptidase MepM and murein hydrolase activator NlpD, contain LysM domain [Daejeonella lutea]
MIVSKSDFSTVLVVGTTKGETKSLRVKTKHINRIKQYAFTICLTLLLLTVTIIFLSLEISKIKQERIAYAREIAHLKSQIPVAADTTQARNYIQNIEDKLKKINQYLIKRGIKGFTVKDVGGNNESATELTAEETYALYNDRLEEVLVGIAFTPIGYPANFVMNSRFGYRSDPVRRGRVEFHPGIDFKGRRGDAVKSTADGKVIIAGWFQGYGKCVKIRHKNNLETLYGHLSKVNVKEGQIVNTGQVIGQVGSTGHSTGNHLHYEVRKNGKPINPGSYLSFN